MMSILFNSLKVWLCEMLKDAFGIDQMGQVLDIDLKWRMHKVSDGQRRRVQICMGLLRPYQVVFQHNVNTLLVMKL